MQNSFCPDLWEFCSWINWLANLTLINSWYFLRISCDYLSNEISMIACWLPPLAGFWWKSNRPPLFCLQWSISMLLTKGENLSWSINRYLLLNKDGKSIYPPCPPSEFCLNLGSSSTSNDLLAQFSAIYCEF